MKFKHKVAVVIPAFNEEKRIKEVLRDLKKFNLLVIVVDDGSVDRTFLVSKRYCKTVLRHEINLGKGAALKTGIEAAFLLGATAVIIMDSDGQHKTSDIPKFIGALSSGKTDVIFGSRNQGMGVPFVRFTGNKAASVLISLLFGIYVSDLICGFRAFTKKAYSKITWQSLGYGVETEMVIKTGQANLRYFEVPVETVYHDKFKGVTILDALGILFSVFKWRLSK
ncbi:hypothetical protein A3D83_04890 [Candidatus Daviesbacteria bacterium RIFCSPHIGHO2_02_FULL_41_10]|uniref:Glycosyltransferase 2-like domain-containing protein n=2 Tax=Candidatus Daviesiibacteriota TaxID=1752718 RepID=A0A1F5ISN8_9BACT|nr:MAG: hypothetical protein A2871_00875 [Candidatus Daviesbacteria bacterium RIFCSPHIGHO2_01_FULL_41_23]OGE32973.1 MAG: hypothetical protein A3D83_04890 [Candidatus Daviesbacteria bacterium RIFCSPHIGHO2_02_FULL_41_10]OGE62447.1 MAG: hypothetical protein A2967_01360 [Candidatus Daviesbacteria bacterium RIFCSPLOWO2_01_FULL_41_32]